MWIINRGGRSIGGMIWEIVIGIVVFALGWGLSDWARRYGYCKGARKYLSLSLEKVALLENLDEGVITLNREGEVTFANAKALLFLKFDKSFFGSKFSKFTEKSPIVKKLQGLVQEAETNQRREHCHLDLLKLIAIPLPKKLGFILLLQDRSSEQKILDIGKDFIANASHELRTPITIIKGFAETLAEVEDVSDDMFHSILDKIIRNAERMESLVKNLLTLTDLENDFTLDPTPCDLVALIERICNNFALIAPNIHLEQLHNEEEIKILADPVLMELCISNLIKNAIKYSKETPHITIILEQTSDNVKCKVVDKGIGIPPESFERLFDRFYTVNKSHSRKMGGAGLGLSLVKKIIDTHHGKITVESEVGKGSTFTLTFPSFQES